MRVAYQDCGCVALPDEIVSALGLFPGSVIDISYNAESRVATLAVVDLVNAVTEKITAASCRIRTVGA